MRAFKPCTMACNRNAYLLSPLAFRQRVAYFVCRHPFVTIDRVGYLSAQPPERAEERLRSSIIVLFRLAIVESLSNGPWESSNIFTY